MSIAYNVLIVDDVSDNIKVAMNILKENNYNFSFALDGKQALDIIKTKPFDLVLLDIMMPLMNGYEVCKTLKQDPKTSDIPVIFLTAKADLDSLSKGFKVGAVDYITKPFYADELISRVSTHIELYRAKKVLQQNNLDLNVKILQSEKRFLSELESNQKEIIYLLTELMEDTSDETGKHIKRVADISKLLATLHESLSDIEVDDIFFAAPLHDIGKITIPYEILHKPGKLSEEEFFAMQAHTTNAHKLLKKSSRRLMKAGDIIAYQHHEKWDGSGYPQGLKQEEIHVYARIVAIADVLDALTHVRVYKQPWNFDAAANYIIERKGTQFDPYLIELFQDNLESFRKIIEEES
ncbi:MAG: response regulator [Sulfurospirillaceae bacterium]|nr:response regulator [Sulfurospirillaceae bacterium]